MAEYTFSNGDFNYEPQPSQNYDPSKFIKEEKKGGVGKGFIALMLCLTVVLSALSGFGGIMLGKTMAAEEQQGTSNPNGSISNNGGASGPSTVIVNSSEDKTAYIGSYAEVAAAAKNTVVEITTEVVQTSTYFGQYVTSGAGSGVILSDDGLIITNNHVIDGASAISVRTTDGKVYPATLLGTDPDTDIAVLKIDASSLPFAIVGNSDNLSVGTEVLAIGNPLGELGGTVTNGIISALDREIEIDGVTMNLLQTNAAVNPGNSGGGLFNMAGELIGIVNAKSSGSDVEGLGFAIPSNDAFDIFSQLCEKGYVSGRPYLGIEVYELKSVSFQSYYQGFTKEGVYIMKSDLNPSLQYMDRIIAVDDVEVTTFADVKKALSGHAIGDVIKVTVVRNGKQVTVEATCFENIPNQAETEKNFDNNN